MNRLKFRVWDKTLKRFLCPDINQFAVLANGKLIISDSEWYSGLQNVNSGDYVIQQFTGLQDYRITRFRK